MTRRTGGAVRCASATYAGRLVVEGTVWDDWDVWQMTVGGNARQRRRRMRELRRQGFRVSVGGVSS